MVYWDNSGRLSATDYNITFGVNSGPNYSVVQYDRTNFGIYPDYYFTGTLTVPVYVSSSNCGTGTPFYVNVNVQPSYRYAIYPNPTSTELTIDFDMVDEEVETTKSLVTQPSTAVEREVKLMNGKGEVLRYEKSKTVKMKFDTGTLPNGTYFLHIKEGKELVKRQIVIQH